MPLGVRFVQLRLKDAPESEVRAQIARAMELCAQHTARNLSSTTTGARRSELGADFVHLGPGRSGQAADVPAIRQAGIRLGISSHDRARTGHGACRRARITVALGPIYETKLKVMKWAPQGLDRVSAVEKGGDARARWWRSAASRLSARRMCWPPGPTASLWSPISSRARSRSAHPRVAREARSEKVGAGFESRGQKAAHPALVPSTKLKPVP